MKVNLIPKTCLGKWSVGLIIAFFFLLGFFRVLVAFGQRGGATFFSNLILAIPAILMGTSGVLAFFVGIISFLKSKERAILVFITTLIGLFVLIFILGEILSPH